MFIIMDKSQTQILNSSTKVSAEATKFLSHLGNQISFLALGSTNDQSVIKGQVLDLSLTTKIFNRLIELKPVKIFMVQASDYMMLVWS